MNNEDKMNEVISSRFSNRAKVNVIEGGNIISVEILQNKLVLISKESSFGFTVNYESEFSESLLDSLLYDY